VTRKLGREPARRCNPELASIGSRTSSQVSDGLGTGLAEVDGFDPDTVIT